MGGLARKKKDGKVALRSKRDGGGGGVFGSGVKRILNAKEKGVGKSAEKKRGREEKELGRGCGELLNLKTNIGKKRESHRRNSELPRLLCERKSSPSKQSLRATLTEKKGRKNRRDRHLKTIKEGTARVSSCPARRDRGVSLFWIQGRESDALIKKQKIQKKKNPYSNGSKDHRGGNDSNEGQGEQKGKKPSASLGQNPT